MYVWLITPLYATYRSEIISNPFCYFIITNNLQLQQQIMYEENRSMIFSSILSILANLNIQSVNTGSFEDMDKIYEGKENDLQIAKIKRVHIFVNLFLFTTSG